jgi:hypothetical protein
MRVMRKRKEKNEGKKILGIIIYPVVSVGTKPLLATSSPRC